MPAFIEYPDDWIGIPDFGEGELFGTPLAWATALTDELMEDAGEVLADEPRDALIGALALIATGIAERGAMTSYVWLASLHGPIDVVDVVMVSRYDVGDATADEIAGSRETDLLRPPTVTEITTAAGLRGALVVRHAPLDEDAAHIVTLRASVALEQDEGFILLGTAMQDLAQFEAFRPHFLELVESVRWRD